jgi:hypothetical protein
MATKNGITGAAADLARQIEDAVADLHRRHEIAMALACAGQRSCTDHSPVERGVFIALQEQLCDASGFTLAKEKLSDLVTEVCREE